MAGKWFHSLTGLLASTGLALAQSPTPAPLSPAAPVDVRAEEPAALPHAIPFTVCTVSPAPIAAAGTAVVPTASTIPWTVGHGGAVVRAAEAECADHTTHPDWAGPADCGDDSRFWARAEYLFWGIRQQSNLPTVVGSVPLPVAVAGAVTNDSVTQILGGGGSRINYNGQSGGRFTAGLWLDDCQDLGFEGSYFQIAKDTFDLARSTSPDTVPGPVFTPAGGGQTIVLPTNSFVTPQGTFTQNPAAQVASVRASASNQLWGAELNARKSIPAIFFADRLEVFAGARYVQFDETLDLSSSITSPPGIAPLPNQATNDHFSVHSRFYGPQIGLTSKWSYHDFFLEATGKFGIGIVEQQANVSGGTAIQLPGMATAMLPGGLFTQPTNIGSFDRGKFSELAEFTTIGGYQFTSGIRAFVGYNFLFVNNVVRAGGQLSAVDTRQVQVQTFPTPRPADAIQPAFHFNEARFWAYGLTTGLEFKY